MADSGKRRSARVTVARLWIPATVAVALLAAALVAVRTPSESLVNRAELQVRPTNEPLSLGNPHVVYRLDGTGGARVSYIGATGELAIESVQLPWSHEIVLSSPMRPASVTATAVGAGEVSCELRVDGQSRDARTSSPGSGVVLCSVVAA